MQKRRPEHFLSSVVENVPDAFFTIAPSSLGESSTSILDEGPQSFAPAVPGAIAVEAPLLKVNETIEKQLFDASAAYEKDGDFRWFFAYSHAGITQRINAAMKSANSNFEQPNAMLKFNIHFGSRFPARLQAYPRSRGKRRSWLARCWKWKATPR